MKILKNKIFWFAIVIAGAAIVYFRNELFDKEKGVLRNANQIFGRSSMKIAEKKRKKQDLNRGNFTEIEPDISEKEETVKREVNKTTLQQVQVQNNSGEI